MKLKLIFFNFTKYIKKSKIFKFLDLLINYIIIIVLISAVITIFASKVSTNGDIMGYKVLRIMSGSMEPLIKSGSIIIVNTKCNRDQFKIGDVITYTDNDNLNFLITNRIKDIEKNDLGVSYFTKGDNNENQGVEKIRAANVVGIFENISISNMGNLSNFINTKKGAVYILIIPGLMLILYQIIKIVFVFIDEDKKRNVKIKSM